MSKVIFCFLVCLSMAYGQQWGFGPCPNVPVKNPFSVALYAGKWYEAEKYPNSFQANGKCTTATYTPAGSGVTVFNKQYHTQTNAITTINGTASLANSASTEGKLLVSFPSANFGFPAPYWVLDTDYTSYSVVYGCTDFFWLINLKFVWILTRTPASATLQPAYAALDRTGITTAPLVKTEQINCPLNN